MAHIQSAKYPSHRTIEAAEFRLIFGIGFTAFLLGAIVSRLTPWRHPERDRKQSIFAQARAATYRTIPFAFMS